MGTREPQQDPLTTWHLHPPRGMARVALSPGSTRWQQVPFLRLQGTSPRWWHFSREWGIHLCVSLLRSSPSQTPPRVGACHFPLFLLRCKAGAPRVPEHIPQNPLPTLLGGETRVRGRRGSRSATLPSSGLSTWDCGKEAEGTRPPPPPPSSWGL